MRVTKSKIYYTLFFIVAGAMIFLLMPGEQEKVSFKHIKSSSSPKASPEMKAARWEHFHNLLRDPASGTIPDGIRKREMTYARTLPVAGRSFLKPGQDSGYEWSEAGPVDVGGRTRALAVDITNSNTILAGGVSGGLWKSIDNGASWTLRNTPVQQLAVTSVAQDTRDGETDTWYYVTGEFIGNSARDRGATAFWQGSGVYKSTDGGDTWTLLPNTVDSNPTSWNSPYDYVTRVAVSPTTGSVFLATNGIGIYRSQDGGTNFSRVLAEPNDHYHSDVVINGSGTVIVSLSEDGFNAEPVNTPGIYKSTNDGTGWDDITPGSFPAVHERSVIALAPSDGDILYVLTDTGEESGGVDDVRFHKIAVGAGTSVDRSANMPAFGTSAFDGVLDMQFSYNMVIAVKPDDPDFVLIGGTNLFRSRDAFATTPSDKYDSWIGGYRQGGGSYPGQHPDQHVITFDPNDANKIWVGHDGGLSYATDIRTATTLTITLPWIDKNQSYNVTQFYTVAISANSGDERIVGGTQDNGSPFFRWDGVSTSSSLDASGGDGAYAYMGDSFLFTSSQNGNLLRQGYDGNFDPDPFNWSYIYPSDATGQLFINPFAVDPANENVVFYAGGDELWRNAFVGTLPLGLTSGTTTNWSHPAALALSSPYIITAMAVSTTNPIHVLYYGGSDTQGSSTPVIYRLESASTATSGKVDRSPAGAAGGAYVHSIAVNPADADEIMVVLSNYNIIGLYHSSDGGQNYSAVEGNLEGSGGNGPSLRTATIVPTEEGTIYLVGTSTGLYSTKILDGANTVWSQEGATEIGNVVVEYITSRDSDDRVAVGTHGRGIYIGNRGAAAIDENSSPGVPTEFALQQNFPNPFNPATTISYSLPSAGQVSIVLYDLNGREVRTLVDNYKSRGNHKLNLNASDLATGTYLYKMVSGEFTQTRKLMVLK